MTTYKRMWENKGHTPWWSVPHLGFVTKPLKELTGFSYKKTVFVVTPDMSNKAYFNVDEMWSASEHFARLYKNRTRTAKLLKTIKSRYREAVRMEAWAWKQAWKTYTTPRLLTALNRLYRLEMKVLPCIQVSQPQHVVALEEQMTELTTGLSNANAIIQQVTQYRGAMPWDRERAELRKLHRIWNTQTPAQQQSALARLIQRYGWFNDIEGDRPFDEVHYLVEIQYFTEEEHIRPSRIPISRELRHLGALIGELGYLRFWARWHFMHLRYHLKRILAELVARSGEPDLAFTTIEEVKHHFTNRKLNWDEIRARKQGWVSVIENNAVRLVTGAKAEKYLALTREEVAESSEIVGRVANRGKVRGKVRIISFAAADYHAQVSAFRKGEILVTGMTRPQIVHLCHKAAAIVTDEGGITSHAAVVSRELNIPCVIATHNATKVLKTGDRVEVDAEKGIVRKLS